jgi:hypothetical protein
VLVLLVHAAVTLVNVGIIWLVQVVHYPLFAGVGEAGWPAYHLGHSRRISRVVGPTMAVEAVTAALLVVAPPDGVPAALAVAGLAGVGVVWASTRLLQVPAHRRLRTGFDPAWHARLVAGNWLRTAVWTLRGLLVLVMLAGAR